MPRSSSAWMTESTARFAPRRRIDAKDAMAEPALLMAAVAGHAEIVRTTPRRTGRSRPPRRRGKNRDGVGGHEGPSGDRPNAGAQVEGLARHPCSGPLLGKSDRLRELLTATPESDSSDQRAQLRTASSRRPRRTRQFGPAAARTRCGREGDGTNRRGGLLTRINGRRSTSPRWANQPKIAASCSTREPPSMPRMSAS